METDLNELFKESKELFTSLFSKLTKCKTQEEKRTTLRKHSSNFVSISFKITFHCLNSGIKKDKIYEDTVGDEGAFSALKSIDSKLFSDVKEAHIAAINAYNLKNKF